MKIARKQIYLGDLLEFWFEDKDDEYHIDFTRGKYGVSCNASGKTVFLLEWLDPEIEISPHEFKKECNLFKRWSGGFDATWARRGKVKGDPRFIVGHAKAITYRSDKFSGKPINYRHQYKAGNCLVYANTKGNNPKVFAIRQQTGKRIVDSRGLLG